MEKLACLDLGSTGSFEVIELTKHGGITVSLQFGGDGTSPPKEAVWYRRCWTDGGRGWFPQAFCTADPELPAARARKAKESFDGSGRGSDYLIFVEGDSILPVPHPEESDEEWAFGVLFDQDAVAADHGPVVGWFPATHLGDPAQCSSGALRADFYFDGRCHGSDCLSLRVGDVLVPFLHPAAANGWCFGALLLDRHFPTASPPALLPPEGLFGTPSGAIAWPDGPPLIQEAGRYHGCAPRGSGIIALRWLHRVLHVCLEKYRNRLMSFPTGGRKTAYYESIYDCAMREWFE